MKLSIDLNADVGESFGAYQMGADAALFRFITSANIACGFHAGDPTVMAKTVRDAIALGVKTGAHPGYPDLQGFGRRKMVLAPDEMQSILLYQVGALSAFIKAEGGTLSHIKLHGAWYNTACAGGEAAETVVQAVQRLQDAESRAIPLMVLSGSPIVAIAQEAGVPVLQEVFADRAYERDGSLVARAKPGAVLHDVAAAVARMKRLVETGWVTSIDGHEISLKADTICVHGDGAEALHLAEELAEALRLIGNAETADK